MLDKLKNIMKKSILCLASTVMILSGLTTNVFAATGTTGRKVYDNWILANPKDGSEHGHEDYLVVDDQPVFCVDYYTTFHKNVTAGTYKDIGITKEKAKRLSLIAYYGTKVSGRTGKDWYAITLVLCQYHINALYDCLNHIFYDWRIDASSKKCEPEALISIINHKNYPQNSIFTADRGYEDYNLLAYFIENSLKFAIRVKDIDTKNGMMTNIQTEGGAFDMNVTRTLTRLQTKEIKANKDKYVFVSTTSRFDFLGPTQDFYELSFRIVRFKITNDTYETIITNLSEDEFQLEDFKELYHYRWGIIQTFGLCPLSQLYQNPNLLHYSVIY